jgi:Uma2 family endonuclease
VGIKRGAFPRRELANVTRPLTCDDLWRIREASDERLEIIAGELFATPPSNPKHQLILGRLGSETWRSIEDRDHGIAFPAMLDVRLAHDTVVLPDFMVALNERISILREWGLDGAPSLLVEIVSDHSIARDYAYKRDLYAWYEIPEYWIVDPRDEHITVCSNPQDGRYLAECKASDMAVSATIAGLSIEAPPLFDPPFSTKRRAKQESTLMGDQDT